MYEKYRLKIIFNIQYKQFRNLKKNPSKKIKNSKYSETSEYNKTSEPVYGCEQLLRKNFMRAYHMYEV